MGRTRYATGVAPSKKATGAVTASQKRRTRDPSPPPPPPPPPPKVKGRRDNFKNKAEPKVGKGIGKLLTDLKRLDGITIQQNHNLKAPLRSSSRSRLPSIPYQAPESLLKIIPAFSKAKKQANQTPTPTPTIEALIPIPIPTKLKAQPRSSSLSTKTSKRATSTLKNAKKSPSKKTPPKTTKESNSKKATPQKTPPKNKLVKTVLRKGVKIPAARKAAQKTVKKVFTKVAVAKKIKSKAGGAAGASKIARPRKRKINQTDPEPEPEPELGPGPDPDEMDISDEDVDVDEDEDEKKQSKKNNAKKSKLSNNSADVKTKKSSAKKPKTEKPPKVKPPKKPKKRRGEILEAKDHLPIYEKDPTFESKCQIPSISTIADSRLLFRAIHLKDNALLKSLLTPAKKTTLCTLAPERSLAIDRTPIDYALEMGNVEAIKLLTEPKVEEGLGSTPELLLQERSSHGRGGGSRNRMMFGHALRDVTVGRGGKEGNHAFSYDDAQYNAYARRNNDLGLLTAPAMKYGLSYDVLEKINEIRPPTSAYIAPFLTSCVENVLTAIRYGHRELAGRLVQDAIKRDGYGFNFLHAEVLLKNGGESLSPFKSVSVGKKATMSSRITPLHCAAINPDPEYLIELLNSKPEIQILDADNWSLLHYAVVCEGTGPLEYLLKRGGISLLSVNKEGNTPFHLACQRGRTAHAQVIIDHELSAMGADDDGSDPVDPDDEVATKGKAKPKNKEREALLKFSGTSLILSNKSGLTPLHIAAMSGHVAILRALLKIPGMDVNKNIPAQYDRLTPLMLASQHGHLHVVQYFAEERESLGLKFEIPDRRGRTGLAHAVINGHAHIVSFLLRLGVNHLTKDSSGNTLVHYAAAYGWYFNLKLVLDAGCPVGEGNQWKMTPVAIAFMKGHIGLVQFLMALPGVDINSPVNDSTGVTLLMEACQSTPSKNFMDRIIFLLDKMGADCLITDFAKNNCLHLLVNKEKKCLEAHWIKNSTGSNVAYSSSEEQKYLFSAIKLLLSRGCSLTALNEHQETPVSLALSATPCFDLLVQVFQESESSIPLTPNKSGDNILHIMTPYVTFASADTFCKKLLRNPANLVTLKDLAQGVNSSGYTPLLLFVKNLPSTQVAEELTRAKFFLSLLLNKLNSDVNAIVQDKLRHSVLHLLAASSSSSGCGLFISDFLSPSQKHQKSIINLEILSAEKRTPLITAILGKNMAVTHALIGAGANVNLKLNTQPHLSGSERDLNTKSLLVYVCEEPRDGTFNLVPLLIEKGARVSDVDPKSGNSPLHYIASRPNYKGAMESIQLILQKGFPADALNKMGRSPLHLLVNARGGETDVSFDIEDILIEKAPRSLAIRDFRGRVPLHYAFTKVGKVGARSFIDPIELVGILVQGMKDHGLREEIKCVDHFGSMPLHYAARRGATISSSCLVNETNARLIDLDDLLGNTPFGLAVLNGHEGCALAFQQLNGNFTLSLNTDQTVSSLQGSNEVEAEDSDADSWTWKQLKIGSSELAKKSAKEKMSTVLEEVVRKDWQGILHLMLETLKNSGASVAPGIQAAIKTYRLKLGLKLIGRIKNGAQELENDGAGKGEGTLLHTLAKYRHLASAANREDEGLKIFASLMSKGVDIFARDRLQSTALVHAAKVRDHGMLEKIWSEMNRRVGAAGAGTGATAGGDLFGRNSFSALFWSLGDTQLAQNVEQWAVQHCDSDEFNVLCRYPVRLSKYPGVRYFRLGLDEDVDENEEGEGEGGEHLLSPLIVAVVYGNYSAVKWLLDLRTKIDVNFQDGLGRTAIMHAARLNDIKMVKLLLNPKGYKPHEDNIPWDPKSFYTHQNNHQINLLLRDRSGLNVIDHLILPSSLPFSYAKAQLLLKILVKANKTLLSPDILAKALRENKQHVAQAIQELQGVPPSKQIRPTQEYPPLIPIPESESESGSESGSSSENHRKPNFMEDAQKMASRVIAEAELKESKKLPHGQNSNSKFLLIPDPLIGSEAKDYEVAIDLENDLPFDCVLTKVDLSYGMYGLYNFYKMQLLTQPKGKGMILLFTRWGRIGDEGQFQKTPFSSYEEAVKEFKKIFRSKSGNCWEDLKGPTGFVPLPKKYRLVHKDLRNRKKPHEVKVDFKSVQEFGSQLNISSHISKATRDLIRDLSLVHQNPYSILNECDADAALPFGQLTLDSMARGEEVLKKIEVVLEENKKLCENYDHSKEEEQRNMETLVNLSEEYYSIVPVFGFNTEKLSPIFTSDDLRNKQELLSSFLHLEFATQLLLGAHFNCTNNNDGGMTAPSTSTSNSSEAVLNPYEYVYNCLGTKIQVLSPQEDEAQLVLQYIHNTSSNSNSSTKVTNIFRIERQEEIGRLENLEERNPLGNRWLLWHGTKNVNLLSILSRGLQVAPIGVQLSGHLFGKGIYFADMFQKSEGYCVGSGGVSYMFLCEVILGKVHPVNCNDSHEDSPTGLPAGCHSVVTADSQYEPDPGTAIIWKGRTVPLGKPTKKVLGKDVYYGLSYNEYIIFNPEQVRIKYLVQF